MDGVGLVDDRAEAVGTGDSPGKESDGSDRRVDRLSGEQMTDFVNGEPQGWKREQPE